MDVCPERVVETNSSTDETQPAVEVTDKDAMDDEPSASDAARATVGGGDVEMEGVSASISERPSEPREKRRVKRRRKIKKQRRSKDAKGYLGAVLDTSLPCPSCLFSPFFCPLLTSARDCDFDGIFFDCSR